MKILLAAIALALGVLLAWQWRDWPPEPDAGRRVVQDPGVPGLAESASPQVRIDPPPEKEDFLSIVERPLFLEERRPPPEEEEEESHAVPEEPPQPEVALDTLDFNAVLITPEEAVAWVRTPSNPRPEEVRIGDAVAGWTVKAISNSEIELEWQGKSDWLVLRDYSKSPPAARPPRPKRQPRQRNSPPRPTPPSTPPRSRNHAQRPSQPPR